MECLVTQLKTAIDDSSLIRIDELKLSVTGSSGISYLYLYWSGGKQEDCTVKVKGTTFEDGTTEKSFSPKVSHTVAIVNALNAEVSILNKYNLQELTFRYDSKLLLSTKNMKYLSGLVNNISLKLSGSIEDIMYLRKTFGKVNLLDVLGTQDFEGDISLLEPFASELYSLVIENTNLTGDITNILMNAKNLSNRLVAINGSKKITLGDISQINHDSVRCIDAGYHVMQWKTVRSSERKIISLNNVTLNDDVDAMLINQASCVEGYSGQSDYRYKAMNVWGTRTSASDAAVATLKAMGYNVSINGVAI